MILPMMILQTFGFPLWLNLMIGQFIGACIFWEVDKRIFGQHKKDSLEEELDKEINSII